MNFQKKKLLYVLKMMLSARNVDNKAMNLLRQGKTFFHIAGAGHEAVQLAIGLSLDPKKDWLFPYYQRYGNSVHCRINCRRNISWNIR